MSVATSFFDVGGGGGKLDNGFPEQPNGNGGVDNQASKRLIPILGSTDAIRMPTDPQASGLTALGYRRIDNRGSGAASEWLISWDTIATFLTVNAITLSDSPWGPCHIRDGKIYISFTDASNAIGNGLNTPHMVKADMTTGAIESVTYINLTNLTIGLKATQDLFFSWDSTSDYIFWEILDNGNLRVVSGYGDSTYVDKGMLIYELSTDYATVVFEKAYFENDGPLSSDTDLITYSTLDGTLCLAKGPSNTMRMFAPGYGDGGVIAYISTLTDFPTNHVVKDAAQVQRGTTTATGNILYDNWVAIGRNMGSTTVDAASRQYLLREDFDNHLKQLFQAKMGILLP